MDPLPERLFRCLQALKQRFPVTISSDHGRIGPFWWVNGVTSSSILRNAVYDGSVHTVWRPGVSGWGNPLGRTFRWRTINTNQEV